MARSNRPIPLVLMLLLGGMACKTPPTPPLDGVWTMSDQSRDALPFALREATPGIVLEPNGDFVAYEMPGLISLPGRYESHLDSGTGRWEIVRGERKRQIRLDFKNIEGANSSISYSTALEISGSSLTYNLGYPDEDAQVTLQHE